MPSIVLARQSLHSTIPVRQLFNAYEGTASRVDVSKNTLLFFLLNRKVVFIASVPAFCTITAALFRSAKTGLVACELLCSLSAPA